MDQGFPHRRAVLGYGAGLGLIGTAGAAWAQAQTPTAVVRTSDGPVRGFVDGTIQTFRGIRYGAPPVGALRFRPPRKPAPWTEVADAIAYGPMAYQTDPAQPGAAGRGPINQSEDCLFLNVWTPGLDRKKRPVMVWLHGGGFFAGSGAGPLYDGGNLARKGDTVIVTVNHRLNVFGYLHLGDVMGPDYATSGNNGQLDIVQVLEWVRDNIDKFGGDAGNVTIFGESGGGAKVSFIMAMPAARGLFHRAVMQSGPGLHGVDRAQATEAARSMLDEVKIAPGDIAALRAVPPEVLLRAQRPALARVKPVGPDVSGLGQGFNLGPVIDGVSAPRSPWDPDGDPLNKDVPVMVGTNKDEGTFFLRSDPKFGKFTEADLAERIKVYGDKGPPLLAEFRRIHPTYSPTYLLTDMMTANMMWGGSIYLAERKYAQHAAPVWMYRLVWENPANGAVLKTPHAQDLPLLFHTTALMQNPDAAKVSDQMMSAWLAFARHGNPNAAELPHWPAYDPKTRATMQFDVVSKIENDPNGGARRILHG
jgi:para-nitrobenzyl esterase